MSMQTTTTGKEGLYDSSKQSFLQRKHDQEEIVRFTDHIFGKNVSLNFETYSKIN